MSKQSDTEQVIDEVRLLWNALVSHGGELHSRERITMGMRAMLEFLQRNGPTTVPNVARSRGVTRQHVQTLMNQLLDDRLVKAEANPAHKRSPLMALTASGERAISRMRKREARVLGGVGRDISKADLAHTADVLRRIRSGLEA